jgi:hypothetical protein
MGVVKAARAHVECAAWGTGKQQRLDGVEFSEKRANLPLPVSIKSADARDLEITMTSQLTREAEQAFFTEALYKLVLVVRLSLRVDMIEAIV